MWVKYNRITKLKKLSVEYLCRDWNDYLILISFGNDLANSYYKVTKLIKATRDKIVKDHKDLNSESAILIALNERDPYSFARRFLEKHFE